MKKVIALIFVALLLVANIGYADVGIDLSAMTLEELTTLRDEINALIKANVEDNNAMIYVGDFLVGKDIRAGSYIITCTKEEENASDGMIIAIYDSGDTYEMNKSKSVYYDFRDNANVFIGIDLGETTIINLEEGQHLIIRWGEGTCKSYAPAWAP